MLWFFLFISSGEVQYNSRVEDIRILKLEIRKLRRERALLSKSVSNVDELKYVKNIVCVLTLHWRMYLA